MYNSNCNLSPIMLALSLVSVQSNDFNFKNVVSRINVYLRSCTLLSFDLFLLLRSHSSDDVMTCKMNQYV